MLKYIYALKSVKISKFSEKENMKTLNAETLKRILLFKHEKPYKIKNTNALIKAPPINLHIGIGYRKLRCDEIQPYCESAICVPKQKISAKQQAVREFTCTMEYRYLPAAFCRLTPAPPPISHITVWENKKKNSEKRMS